MMDDLKDRPAGDSCDERKCREIVESVNSIILRWDTRMNITFANRFALEFFGFRPGEIVGRSLIGTLVPPTSTAGRDLEAMMREIVRNPEGFVNNENENVRQDGTRVWISWTNRAVRDRDGKVVEILSVGNDITGRKRAEEALRRQLEMTQKLLDAIPVPVFYKDTRGVYLGCNQAFADLFGKPKGEIVGRTVFEVAPPDLAEVYHKADEELFHHPGRQSYESAVVDTGGRRHDVIFVKATYLNEDGSVGGLIGTIIDITQRKAMWQELVKARHDLERRVAQRTGELEKANESLRREVSEHRQDEEALRESEERFRATFEQAAVGITHVALDGRYIRVNKKFCDILYYDCEELQNRNYQDITYPEDVPGQEEHTSRLLRGEIGTYSREKRYVRRDGSLVWANLTVSLVRGADGTPKYFMGVVEDITDRKRAEEAMMKAKASAELYLDLMGHDISNMNQAMMGYLEMAQELLDLRGHEELIERPLAIIRHSSRLIASVKKLEQAQSGKYPEKAVDLGLALKEVADAYATVTGREIKIEYAPVEGYYVRASDLLKDVLDHLVENAIRHSTGPLEVAMAVEPLARDGHEYYKVSVADNGPGIPDELKRKVFRLIDEATGSPGRRGLGLFMVRTLVESFHGRVWVEDRVPGDYRKGSRFVVLLPAAEPQRVQEERSKSPL